MANNIIDITQSQNIWREEKISKTLEEKWLDWLPGKQFGNQESFN